VLSLLAKIDDLVEQNKTAPDTAASGIPCYKPPALLVRVFGSNLTYSSNLT
jgi:hypothetical protein